MQFTRNRDLELIYENMVSPQIETYQGLTDDDVGYLIEQYHKLVCVEANINYENYLLENESKVCLPVLDAENTLEEDKKLYVVGKLSDKNAKIPHWSFSLPAGFTCPMANQCFSQANRKTGKIKDGPNTDFRCFAASTEARHANVRQNRWTNFEALKSVGARDAKAMSDVLINTINENLPRNKNVFRIHVGGDFFGPEYFQAWKIVAEQMPSIIFYAYTKSIQFVIDNLPLPNNLIITASKGGKQDDLIDKYNLKYAEVVFSEEEAEEKGLEIDHDDSLAWKSKESFALLLHGTQPAGSKASKALSALKGKGSYSKNKKPSDVYGEG